jgi:hypothetical protein
MTTLADKVSQLKSYLALFGVSNLTDYDTRIFSRDLKKNSEFLGKVKSMEEVLAKTFDIDVDVSSVEQAIKLLKKLLVECDLNFETGRTSETSYMKLSPKCEDTETQRLVGNCVFNCPTYGKESLGEHLRASSDLNYIPDYKYLPFPTLKDKKYNFYEVEVGKPDRICFLIETKKELNESPIYITNMEYTCEPVRKFPNGNIMVIMNTTAYTSGKMEFMIKDCWSTHISSITMMERCVLESDDPTKKELFANGRRENLTKDYTRIQGEHPISLNKYKNDILSYLEITHVGDDVLEETKVILYSGESYTFDKNITRFMGSSTETLPTQTQQSFNIKFSSGSSKGLPLNKVEKIICKYSTSHVNVIFTLHLTTLQTPVQMLADGIIEALTKKNFLGDETSPFVISVFSKFPEVPPVNSRIIDMALGGQRDIEDVRIIIYSVPSGTHFENNKDHVWIHCTSSNVANFALVRNDIVLEDDEEYEEEDEPVVHPNTGFNRLYTLSPKLYEFTGWTSGSEHSRFDVTRFITSYIKEHNLQSPSRPTGIIPDTKLSELLGFYPKNNPDVILTYFTLQTYLQQHYIHHETDHEKKIKGLINDDKMTLSNGLYAFTGWDIHSRHSLKEVSEFISKYIDDCKLEYLGHVHPDERLKSLIMEMPEDALYISKDRCKFLEFILYIRQIHFVEEHSINKELLISKFNERKCLSDDLYSFTGWKAKTKHSLREVSEFLKKYITERGFKRQQGGYYSVDGKMHELFNDIGCHEDAFTFIEMLQHIGLAHFRPSAELINTYSSFDHQKQEKDFLTTLYHL